MGYAKMRRADHAKTANALPFPDHPFAGGKRGYQSVSMVQVTAKRHFAAEDQITLLCPERPPDCRGCGLHCDLCARGCGRGRRAVLPGTAAYARISRA
jgi:hypothetical protein